MKYLGTITDPKDLTTKKYVDDSVGGVQTSLNTLSGRVDTNEDNIAMAESDIEGLQGDVGTLKTSMTAAQGAITTLQDTYVPNTTKVNGKALSADITLTAGDVRALPDTYKPLWIITGNYDSYGGGIIDNIDKTYAEIKVAINDGYQIELKLASTNVTYLASLVLIDAGASQYNPLYFSCLNESTNFFISVNSQNTWKVLSYNFLSASTDDTYDAGNRSIINLRAPINDTDAANKEYVDGVIKDSNVHLYQINSPSIPTSAWVTNTNSQAADQEKTDYPFMATISITSPAVTTNDIARVMFRYVEQASGNFAPNCYTTTNGVIIEAKERPSATITLDYILIERIL